VHVCGPGQGGRRSLTPSVRQRSVCEDDDFASRKVGSARAMLSRTCSDAGGTSLDQSPHIIGSAAGSMRRTGSAMSPGASGTVTQGEAGWVSVRGTTGGPDAGLGGDLYSFRCRLVWDAKRQLVCRLVGTPDVEC
jgi:hypothetical protein